MMKVQHDFFSDRPPEEFLDLRIETEGLREFAVTFDPENPTNFSLITIWDDLEAARRAAGSADLVQEATGAKARSAGAGSLQISPRPKDTQTEY
jgi:heme-degrading monooxygenase HmoA